VIHKALCGRSGEQKENETQETATNIRLNGILNDNDIQKHSSHKADNVQLSQRTHKISDSEDKDNSNRTEDQKITLEPEGISPVSC
jgi:ABC-type uncharacterized transport system involved in gliding motility auxiliary subunit